MRNAAIITCSDKGHAGQREDKAGPTIARLLEEHGYKIFEQIVLPDERAVIAQALTRLCDSGNVELICTSGGTGFSERDVTPEATLDVVERLCPGIPEAMRAFSLSITPRAMLSRAVAGIRGKTLTSTYLAVPRPWKNALAMPWTPWGMAWTSC